MSDFDDMLADEPVREIVCADCLDYLRELPAACVDAVVTDPPYGLAFMGAGWDSFGKGADDYRLAMLPVFEELLRVCKPGAHLLCFGGTRTYHRLTCAAEDAGWEVRDCLMWVYGSGMPHSLDVSKAIDKAAGAERRVVGHKRAGDKRGGNYHGASDRGVTLTLDVTEPATEDARRWEGWGTALKPAWEPVLLARAPLKGTVAANVLAYGTGAINIGASRVPSEAGEGRWPANLAHDGSDEATGAFPEAKGQIASRGAMPKPSVNCYGSYGAASEFPKRGDAGSAARFFYCAKASKADRGEGNDHPTVKPLALMEWLVGLVAARGGVVLDPFCGSGSTLVAAARMGIDFIGIDSEPHFCDIARTRVSGVMAGD